MRRRRATKLPLATLEGAEGVCALVGGIIRGEHLRYNCRRQLHVGQRSCPMLHFSMPLRGILNLGSLIP